MGLDNSLTFRIKCPSLGIHWKEYDVCYFRKYWGLRRQMLEIIGTFDRDDYEHSLTRENIYNFADLLEKYTNIDNVRIADLSTIWDEIQECYHIRDEYRKIKFAEDFYNEKISLYEFIYVLSLWNGEDKVNQTLLDLLSKGEELPKDFEWAFCFSDSY